MKSISLFLILLLPHDLIAVEKCAVRSVFNLAAFAKEDISGDGFKSNGSLAAGKTISIQNAEVNTSDCRALASSGKITVRNSTINGSIESFGLMNVTNTEVNGDVRSPLRIELINSLVKNIISPKSPKNINSNFEKQWSSSPLQSLDLGSFVKELNKTSEAYVLLSVSPEIKIIKYKENLTLSLKKPMNVINFSVQDFKKIKNIEIRGDIDQQLIINVTGAEAQIDDLTIDITGSIEPDHIIWNFHEAQKISIFNNSNQRLGMPGKIIAPHARVYIVNALLTGSVYAKAIVVQSIDNGETAFRDTRFIN